MAKKKNDKVCLRAYWNKSIVFPAGLRLNVVAQPLTAEGSHIGFHNACPTCQNGLNKVDVCPECSKQAGQLVKVQYQDIVKTYESGGKKVIFTQDELKTIYSATEDIKAIGYGSASEIRLPNVSSAYALLPQEVEKDADYRRLLKALKESQRYIAVSFDDRGSSKHGVVIYTGMDGKEFLLLVNLQDCKDINDAVFYESEEITESVKPVNEFIEKALPKISFKDITDNAVEQAKQKLILDKIAGKAIKVAEQPKVKETENGFANAIAALKVKA